KPCLRGVNPASLRPHSAEEDEDGPARHFPPFEEPAGFRGARNKVQPNNAGTMGGGSSGCGTPPGLPRRPGATPHHRTAPAAALTGQRGEPDVLGPLEDRGPALLHRPTAPRPRRVSRVTRFGTSGRFRSRR